MTLGEFQKQLFADILQNRCSKNFCNIHRKTIALESFFNKFTGPSPATLLKKRLQDWCFPWKIAKLLRTTFLKNTSGDRFWNLSSAI